MEKAAQIRRLFLSGGDFRTAHSPADMSDEISYSAVADVLSNEGNATHGVIT
jgi:hypothetical protein